MEDFMEQSEYEFMKQNDASHWWFRARKNILKTITQKFKHVDEHVVEIGCGTGANLKWLGKFSAPVGYELDSSMAEYAQSNSGHVVHNNKFPDEVALSSVGNVVMFDVLEHIENDAEALRSVFSALSEGGRLIVTVPAYQWLWSKHDEAHHHHRRYTLTQLEKLCCDAGYEKVYSSYFNALLFPLAVAGRLAEKFFPGRAVGQGNGNKFLNETFYRIFNSEVGLMKYFKLPFGLSIVMVLEKPRGTSCS